MADVRRRTVCLDFDGVLHAYSRGWADGSIYDGPLPGAVEGVRWLAERFRLVVSTCREDVPAVWRWLGEHGIAGDVELVTNEKPIAVVYVDDRGLHFTGWDQLLEIAERAS